MSKEHDMIKSNYITYLSNAGVMIKINDKKVLVDAFCNYDVPIYKSTPVDILDQLINGIEPFKNIDLILITHNHSDHFDSKSICRFLLKNMNTVVVSTPEVITILRQDAYNIDADRLIELNIKAGCFEKVMIKGIEVQAISMVHEGKEYINIDNFAYLIEYNETSVMHLGDAAPVIQNFEQLGLQQYRIDLLIANFPYIAIPSARQIVKELINPRKIAVVHLPYQEFDRFDWIKAAKKSYDTVRGNFVPALFLEDIGSTMEI
ncbi:MAG: MBL fold metallo-hydrolase [Lutisporaceae bacterium]